jgi:hypothetical protein
VPLVEYGDFECLLRPAEPVVRALLANLGDLRYVWRHLPLTDVHPNAALSAEAAEAADRQGAFWPMHDLLLQHQQELQAGDAVPRLSSAAAARRCVFGGSLWPSLAKIELMCLSTAAALSGCSPSDLRASLIR